MNSKLNNIIILQLVSGKCVDPVGSEIVTSSHNRNQNAKKVDFFRRINFLRQDPASNRRSNCFFVRQMISRRNGSQIPTREVPHPKISVLNEHMMFFQMRKFRLRNPRGCSIRPLGSNGSEAMTAAMAAAGPAGPRFPATGSSQPQPATDVSA